MVGHEKRIYFKMAVKNRHNFRAKKLPTPAHQNYAASLRFTSCSFFMFVFSLATIKPEDSKYIIAKGQMKSECIYEIIDFPKYHRKNLIDFCSESSFRLGITTS